MAEIIRTTRFEKEYLAARRRLYRVKKFTGITDEEVCLDDVDLFSFFTGDSLRGLPYRKEILEEIATGNISMHPSDVHRLFWKILKNANGDPEPERPVPEECMDRVERISDVFLKLVWFKVFRLKEFYAAVFSEDYDGWPDTGMMTSSRTILEYELRDFMSELSREPKQEAESDTSWMQHTVSLIEQILECRDNGIGFLPVDINVSDPHRYLPETDGIRLPFDSIYDLTVTEIEEVLEFRKEKTITGVSDLRGILDSEKLETLSCMGVFDTPNTEKPMFSSIGKIMEETALKEVYLRFNYRCPETKAKPVEDLCVQEESSANGVHVSLGDFDNGKYYVVAGRPAMGKTAYLLSLALEAARKGTKVWYVCLEDRAESLVERLFHKVAGITDRHTWDCYYEKDCLDAVKKELPNLPIFFCEGITGFGGIEEVLQKEVHGGMIVIDYLDLIQMNGYHGVELERRSGMEQQRLISQRLKALAREKGVPLVAAASVARSVESRSDKHPVLGDIRSLAGGEKYVDGISALYRESYYDPKADENTVERILLKDPGGKTGAVPLVRF